MNQIAMEFVRFVRDKYKKPEGVIPLHEPVFAGNEKKYLIDCVDSTFVSSVGEFVTRFEKMLAEFTGVKYAIATMNGTAALHAALILAGVKRDDEIITQPLSFIATCNAITYCGAEPVFVDVDIDTMGMSAKSLKLFFEQQTRRAKGGCYNKVTGKRISAVVPMHTFGHPCRIDEIALLCAEHRVALIEDAAESLGSFYKDKHTGTFGGTGVISFNGNKTITTGGGGAILTKSEDIAVKAKHITTTAKLSHPYEYVHDMTGFNYRLPNINAALGCAQMEKLREMLATKRLLADMYKDFFASKGVAFVTEPEFAHSNYWLNGIIFEKKMERDKFLMETNDAGIATRPVWKLMTELSMYAKAQRAEINNAKWLEERVVNIPSGVTPDRLAPL